MFLLEIRHSKNKRDFSKQQPVVASGSAFRYTEAYEREWRQKEKAARERVAATNRDLAQARAAQQAARVAAQADMARLEAQEFHRIVEENRHSEQQQLEKVCTCASDCIMYTLYIYIYMYTLYTLYNL